MTKKSFPIAAASVMLAGIIFPYLAIAQDASQTGNTVNQEIAVPTKEPDILEILLSQPFSDVPMGSPHYMAVQNLFQNGIIQGFSDGSFRPDEKVNRVEALAMILSSADQLPSEPLSDTQQITLPVDTIIDLSFPFETDIRLKTSTMETPIVLERTDVMQFILPNGGVIKAGRVFLEQDPNFTDVDKSAWYYSILKRALSLGIVKGYGDGTFRPGSPVKLTEALAMLLRTHRIDIPEALAEDQAVPDDVDHSAWYAPYAYYGVEKTLLTPSPNNLISPSTELTRGELATLIYRFTQNQANSATFGKASWYADGASVIRIPERQAYHDANMTAAHKSYPLGTVLRVTDMSNGKHVDVVVNDRGPFVIGRVVDLSKTAFSALEDPGTGVASVQVEVLSPAP